MSIEFDVEVDGADQLLAGLEAAPAVLEAAKTEAMTRSVFVLEAAVKSRTPRVTGRLFSSIHGDVRTGSQLEGRVATSVKYAPWVEVGRGPITARHLTPSGKPGFLRFRKNGRWIYRRTVRPAIGRFMFREGLIASAPVVRGIFRDAVRKVADAIRASGRKRP